MTTRNLHFLQTARNTAQCVNGVVPGSGYSFHIGAMGCSLSISIDGYMVAERGNVYIILQQINIPIVNYKCPSNRSRVSKFATSLFILLSRLSQAAISN